MTTVLIVVLALIAVLAILYFFGSKKGMKLIHSQTVRTIVYVVNSQLKSSPEKPLEQIYFSVAEHRNNKLPSLKKNDYLGHLARFGCFEHGTQMTPESFANTAADIEEFIKYAEAARKFP